MKTTIQRAWVRNAIQRIEADYQRSADTHLVPLLLPQFPQQQLYFKDESIHPSGSLKHRLARSLFLYGLCNGFIGEHTMIVESSSGNTAVSEAYFARLLGLRFIAVMPASTSPEKIKTIKFYGGDCHLVSSAHEVYAEAERLARENNGHYMDQFTYAERVTDWRSNNNIAESIFEQMKREQYCIPRWIVCAAGTGGTSATLGRYIRYCQYETELCVADPEHSVFFDSWRQNRRDLTHEKASRIEGIGRPRCEPSFIASVVDLMLKVPDAASIAAVRVLEDLLGRRCGGSTGTQFVAALQLMCDMRARGEQGSVVTLICDSGDRYTQTCYSDVWVQSQSLDMTHWHEQIYNTLQSGDHLLIE